MWKIAALGAAAMTACYSPTFSSCIVSCEADEDCAPGLACTTANKCARPGEAAQCEATELVDASPDAPLPFGTYHVMLTNRDNGCGFPNWQLGAIGMVDVVISRTNDVVVAEPQGATATFLDAWLGTHVFAGQLTAGRLQLVLAGTKRMTKGNCSYTFDAALSAGSVGLDLQGTLTYQARTNAASACGTLTGCETRQDLAAMR